MRAEAWVAPLSAEETPRRSPAYVAMVKTKYEDAYIAQWVDFFADVKVKVPTSPDEAIDIYRTISESPTPFRHLLEQLSQNTQWREGDLVSDEPDKAATRKFLARIEAYSQAAAPTTALSDLGKRSDKIPAKFKAAVEFGYAAGDSLDLKGPQVHRGHREGAEEQGDQGEGPERRHRLPIDQPPGRCGRSARCLRGAAQWLRSDVRADPQAPSCSIR
ncbi:MAG: hypothetical protein IPG04_07800 [Polyangiaceae bacterium]|nr:hypothetical protein [Polyangiaceae bacterium]